MNEIVNDMRYGVGRLLVTPGFTIVASALNALGIGANGAMYAVVDAVMLRPLPYERPETLRMWRLPRRAGRAFSLPIDVADDESDPARGTGCLPPRSRPRSPRNTIVSRQRTGRDAQDPEAASLPDRDPMQSPNRNRQSSIFNLQSQSSIVNTIVNPQSPMTICSRQSSIVNV